MVELYGTKTNQTLGAAIAELRIEARLDMDAAAQSTYELERAYNRQCIKVWHRGQARLRGESSLTAKSMLTELRCFSTPNQIDALAKTHGILGADDFLELYLDKDERKILGKLGNYHAFAIPCWEQSRLVGMWLVNLKKLGDEVHRGYIFIRMQRHTAGLGYGHAVRIGQDRVVMVNDPRVAIRYMARQALDNITNLVVFAIPTGPEEPLSQLSTQEVLFLPVSANNQPIGQWLKRATFYDGAHTIQEWDLKFSLLGEFRTGDTSRSELRYLTDAAVPAYQAIGSYLLRSGADGPRRAVDLGLSVTQQNQVKSHFSGQDVVELNRYFGNTPETRSIEFEGERIDESKAGWTHDGKTVSSAVIRIDEIHNDAQTNNTIMVGVVSFEDRVIPFREEKKKIRGAETAKWLDQLLSRYGGWFMCHHKWAGRLLDIAHAFSKDSIKTYSNDFPFGWDQDVLRFQRFRVDDVSVSHANHRVGGPDIPYPEPLTPSEWDAFLYPEFCTVALALLGNLLRTRQGLPGYGIVFQSAHHVVERTAEAFAMNAVEDPTLERVIRSSNGPLPLMGRWSDHRLLELMRHGGPKNVMLSVDRHTFGLLAVNPDWLRLPVETVVDYRALRWVFRALPVFLADGEKLPNDRFFSAIAAKIGPIVHQSRPNHVLTSCATELDSNWVLSSNTAGTKTLGLLRQLADDGILPTQMTPDGIKIEHADVRAALASPVLPPADISRLTKQLADAGMLVGAQPGFWIANPQMWDLVAAWSKTQPTKDQ